MASFQAIPVHLPHSIKEWGLLEMLQFHGFPKAYKAARILEHQEFPDDMPAALHDLNRAMEEIRKSA